MYDMCDAIVRSAGMVNLQRRAEMTRPLYQSGNRLDCRPGFIDATALALRVGNEGFDNFHRPVDVDDVLGESEDSYSTRGFFGSIYAPYIYKDKTYIARRAIEMGVPIHLTWSCYKGNDNHCGRCGTCVERLEAINDAVVQLKKEGFLVVMHHVDQTVYDDTEFWQTATREGAKS